MFSRWIAPVVAAGLLFPPLSTERAGACPFCPSSGQTLSGEIEQADFILYGTLSNARPDPNGEFGKGTTDMTIDLVIKPHPAVKDKKTITLPRYQPSDGKDTKFLIFFNLIDGKLDPYRGESVPAKSKLPEYLKGAIEVRKKDSAARMNYFFKYLEDDDLVVSVDAFSEFASADYKEVRPVAEKLPAGTILKWLKDDNTRPTRFGLYGLMLGHCGKKADAAAIRELLDDPKRSFSTGLDGVLAGYVLLDPEAGWDYLMKLAGDGKKEFLVRYAALRTVRFFWEFRPDVVTEAKRLEAMRLLTLYSDIADLPIEDLRKWQRWDQTPAVLDCAKMESHTGIPIVNRSILMFTLSAAPHNTAAAEYVKQARAKNPDKVKFVEDLLKDEVKPTSPPTSSPKTAAPASASK
jgi:hypothetical protein